MAHALRIGADSVLPVTANGWESAETEHRSGISVAVLLIERILQKLPGPTAWAGRADTTLLRSDRT